LCTDFFGLPDSAETIRGERAALLSEVANIYRNSLNSPVRQDLPKVFSARIDRLNATLSVAGPISAGSLQYAQTWYDIHRRFHGGTCVVQMHIIWKTGHQDQVFPLSGP